MIGTHLLVEPRRATVADLVFVHGLEDSWRSWRPLAQRLDPAWRMAAVDLPWGTGSGHRWRRDGLPATHLARLVATRAEPVDVLVGHSFGANAILELLATQQISVRAAVLLAPSYWPPTAPDGWDLFERAKRNFRQTLASSLRIRLGRRLETVPAAVLESMVDKAFDRIGPLGFVAWFEQLVGSGRLPLERITLPILLVSSPSDPSLGRRRATELTERLPNAEQLLLDPEYHHFSHVDRPASVAELITEFVGKALGGAV
ncbi:alpha/beta fold hydrolase [Nocardia sp. NPDC051321]|uniref:alpha/beta fold hydrolase n=1 Tax=Nocardia sp. NPDC051321 TaxID=3364323 RepID=UPI0037979F67